jgi:hypothetical protein
MDIHDGAEWTEMDIDDLKAAIESGRSPHTISVPRRQFGRLRPEVCFLPVLRESSRFYMNNLRGRKFSDNSLETVRPS